MQGFRSSGSDVLKRDMETPRHILLGAKMKFFEQILHLRPRREHCLPPSRSSHRWSEGQRDWEDEGGGVGPGTASGRWSGQVAGAAKLGRGGYGSECEREGAETWTVLAAGVSGSAQEPCWGHGRALCRPVTTGTAGLGWQVVDWEGEQAGGTGGTVAGALVTQGSRSHYRLLGC